MKRVLSSKITVVALVIAIVTLLSSAAWAATNSRGSASPAGQTTSSVVEIVALSLHVPVGGTIKVAGAGFEPGEVVLFTVVQGEGRLNIIIEGGDANGAGAFLAESQLPETVTAGFYTVRALTVGGHVASTPIIICTADDAKCPSS